MQLTEPQRRTLDRLIGTGDRPIFAADVRQRLVDRIEGAARELELAEPLWIGKETLNHLARCEGRFAAKLQGEDPPFEHSPTTAAGVLVHKAIEVDVGARDGLDHTPSPRSPPTGSATGRSGSRSSGAVWRPPGRTSC